MRHLYELSEINKPLKDTLIMTAKSMERRRCSHHTLDRPLSTLECLSSVVDPKGSSTNKHHYVVASQDEDVRRYCRSIKGVPLVYVKRSVMVMEPMTQSSLVVREGIEKEKFRSGIKGTVSGLGKRKREAEENSFGQVKRLPNTEGLTAIQPEQPLKKMKVKGTKGPNPLSVKKSKKPKELKAQKRRDELSQASERNRDSQGVDSDGQNSNKRRKRRRRPVPQQQEDIAQSS